ncbi:MAG: hemolysin family protein [Proteobacteria bacterium]|nr:hemolysin family protein [Pseudomonadota bacterium]
MAYFEILTVVALTFINALLAMSEMAIASSRMPKLRALAEQGVSGARRAIALASEPGRFLSTVQIGITLIGILAGVVSGATLGERVSSVFLGYGLSESMAEALGYGIVIGGITYLSLIIGELVPKQVALRNPERIACLVAPGMSLLAKVAAPIVWLLDKSGKFVLRLLGQGRAKEETVTDAEIHSLIAEAETAGVIEPEERAMIAGVMRLGDRAVRSVMIPRTEVAMVDVSEPAAAIARKIKDTGLSRFVVYDGNQDNIIGVLQAKDLAIAAFRKKMPSIRSLVKEAPVIHDTVDALDVVNKLKEAEVQFGLIYDEYGHFEGVVTALDILQAIVGAFREEKGEPEPEMAARDDGSWLAAGWAPVDAVMQKLGLPPPERRDYQTLAGYMLDKLGHLPSVGESFQDRNYRFEVVDLDGRRIDKVLIEPAGPAMRRVAA